MEEIQSAAKNQNKQEKAEKIARENLKRRNEQILTSLCHSFHPVDSVVWDSLKEKLLDLEKKYDKKKSIFLCAKCMTISTPAHRILHDDITVRSLPDKIDIGASEGVDIGKFFLEYGRHKEDGENKIIVCFPSFNFDCDQTYHQLEGSRKIQCDKIVEDEETGADRIEQSKVENQDLGKRAPPEDEKNKKKKISETKSPFEKDGSKNKGEIWKSAWNSSSDVYTKVTKKQLSGTKRSNEDKRGNL